VHSQPRKTSGITSTLEESLGLLSPARRRLEHRATLYCRGRIEPRQDVPYETPLIGDLAPQAADILIILYRKPPTSPTTEV
jgi:hypothetical protein